MQSSVCSPFPFVFVFDHSVPEDVVSTILFSSLVTGSFLFCPPFSSSSSWSHVLGNLVQGLWKARGSIQAMGGMVYRVTGMDMRTANGFMSIPIPMQKIGQEDGENGMMVPVSISVKEVGKMSIAVVLADLSVVEANGFALDKFREAVLEMKTALLQVGKLDGCEIVSVKDLRILGTAIAHNFVDFEVLNGNCLALNDALCRWILASVPSFCEISVGLLRDESRIALPDVRLEHILSSKRLVACIDAFISAAGSNNLSLSFSSGLMCRRKFDEDVTHSLIRSSQFLLLKHLPLSKPNTTKKSFTCWSYQQKPLPVDVNCIIADHLSHFHRAASSIHSCPAFPADVEKALSVWPQEGKKFTVCFEQINNHKILKDFLPSNSDDSFNSADYPALFSLFQLQSLVVFLRGSVIGSQNASDMQIAQFFQFGSILKKFPPFVGEESPLDISWHHFHRDQVRSGSLHPIEAFLSLNYHLLGFVCVGSLVLCLNLIPNENANKMIRHVSVCLKENLSAVISVNLFHDLNSSISFVSLVHDASKLATLLWSLMRSDAEIGFHSSLRTSGGPIGPVISHSLSESVSARLPMCDISPSLSLLLFGSFTLSELEQHRLAVKDKLLAFLTKTEHSNLSEVDLSPMLLLLQDFLKTALSSQCPVSPFHFLQQSRSLSLNKSDAIVPSVVHNLCFVKEASHFLKLVTILFSKKVPSLMSEIDYSFLKVFPSVLSLPLNKVISTPLASIFDYFFILREKIVVFSPSMEAWVQSLGITSSPAVVSHLYDLNGASQLNCPVFSFSFAIRQHFIGVALRVQKLLRYSKLFSNSEVSTASISSQLLPIGAFNFGFPYRVSGLKNTSLDVEFFVCAHAQTNPDLIYFAFHSFYTNL